MKRKRRTIKAAHITATRISSHVIFVVATHDINENEIKTRTKTYTPCEKRRK
jgi:hypothetical protein